MKPNSSCVLPTGEVGRALVLAGTPDIVRALRRCLPLSGYRIECVAHSGEEAIVSSRTTRLDLAVIDLNAPGGMDGATVCRHLRSEAGLPVVCVASERGTKEARCQEIGDPCAVLTKPLRKSDLRFAIGTAIYRAKLERKLKASESRHKLLTDNVSDVIMALDMERRFTYVSPSITPALGFTVEEFMAKRPEDFIVDARQSRHLSSTLIDLAKRGVPDPSTTATMAFRRKDGGIAWAEVKARLCLDQNHKPFEFIGVARDITERRLKEEALRLSEEKFYKAFHISPDSMTINRLADGVYLDVNDSFTRITGYSAADVLGRSSMVDDLSVWVHNEDRTRLAQALKESGEVVGFQAEFKRKD
ncbi:MAG TPA: PAS domain S-box protein, partial [Bacteroidota bacterium]|nr:PAS domain S-box protein [Bacteroidota bacterium]